MQIKFAADLNSNLSSNDVFIVRHSETPRIKAFYLHSFENLAQLTGLHSLADQCLFADLALGPWQGHWLAREWGRQLGIDVPQGIQPILYSSDENAAKYYADTVGVLIDNESEGDRNVITAYVIAKELISKIVEQNIQHLFVAAPLTDKSWGLENIQLLKLLSDAAPQYGYTLAALFSSDVELPTVKGLEFAPQNKPAQRSHAGRRFQLPGIVCKDMLYPVDEEIEYIELRHGLVFVSPNFRSLEKHVTVPLLSEQQQHLRVYFELASEHQDIDFLQRQAGLRFSEGAYELAFDILEGINRQQLTSLQLASIEAQKQNISIALMDFQRAARGIIPNESLPDVMKASLYQSKAWGLVMTNQAKSAEPYFELARKYLDPNEYQRLYLYLLNISALNKLRLDQIEQALVFEKDIEKQLAAFSEPDWHLIYINCLNQARIFKKLKNFDEAELYYQRAFFVNFQLKNESDLLYTNLCFAQLESLRGNHSKAFMYWIRTCIHWLSNPLPEALAPRVAQAILAKPLSNKEANVEHISLILDKELRLAAQKIAQHYTPALTAIPFSRISAQSQADVCLGQPGWSMYISRKAGNLVFTGNIYTELNKLVVGLVASFFPAVDVSRYASIFTDTQCGIELPANPRELFWSCLKWQVPELIYESKQYEVSTEPRKFIGEFVVAKSRAVNYFKQDHSSWRVYFKRYLNVLTLTEKEQKLLEQLTHPITLTQLSNATKCDLLSCMGFINHLAEKRLVSIL